MIFNMDVMEFCRTYEGPLFHACLCDPPYHLLPTNNRFGKEGAAPAKFGTDGAFQRMSKGFMESSWDGHSSDGGLIAFQPETWAAIMELLHPGAFMMCFAGTRGYHRMACAIEDAGFTLHSAIGWAFGSGFPKATRIDTQIDREAGAEREIIGPSKWGAGFRSAGSGLQGWQRPGHSTEQPETLPATDLARTWSGHRYGLQALKPAFEFICVAQKPYEGRPVDCITRTGAGALNIDAGRIGAGAKQWETPRGGIWQTDSSARATLVDNAQGRWPANFIVGDEAAAAMLDRQSGHLQSGNPCGLKHAANAIYGQYGTEIPITGYGDSGGASRFFFNVQTAIDEADPVIYCAKAGSGEREKGLERFMRQANADWPQSLDGDDARGASPRANNHPTVKSLSLTRHLASLLLPPAEYAPRRLYVPFSGVASEMCGADLAGWEEVNGVEQSAEYCRIGEARRRFWSCNSGLFEEITATVTPTERAGAGDAAAGGLFDTDTEGETS